MDMQRITDLQQLSSFISSTTNEHSRDQLLDLPLPDILEFQSELTTLFVHLNSKLKEYVVRRIPGQNPDPQAVLALWEQFVTDYTLLIQATLDVGAGTSSFKPYFDRLISLMNDMTAVLINEQPAE